MNKYDVIVIGASYGGLVSANYLLNQGYRVLMLERTNHVCGLKDDFRKGRFAFTNHAHNLYCNGNDIYSLARILDVCGIQDKVYYKRLSNRVKVIVRDKEYVLPLDIYSFVDKIDYYVPGSKESMQLFFEIAKECKKAMGTIYKSDFVDYSYIKSEYSHFYRVASYSLSQVLQEIHMPIEAQDILCSLWIFLGSSATEISFVTYALLLLDFVLNGVYVLKDGDTSLSLCLMNRFTEKGGVLKLNQKVDAILIDYNKVTGVKLIDGTTYYADAVVIHTLDQCYMHLMEQNKFLLSAKKRMLNRQLGGRSFVVHLGMNRNMEELGLDSSFYLFYDTLDSDVEIEKMKQIGANSSMAFVYNNEVAEGTCVIDLYTILFENCFGDFITQEDSDYFLCTRKMAKHFISVFEQFVGVKIVDFIEEIDISSPVETAEFTQMIDGCDYGYKLGKVDDVLPKMLDKKSELFVDGLYLYEGTDGDLYGYGSSFIQALETSILLDKEKRGEN